MKSKVLLLVLSGLLLACNSNQKNKAISSVVYIGEMKDVMWKGKLEGKVLLDTLNQKEGLYGLGPMEFLRGELVVLNGSSYVATVGSDSGMQVSKTSDVRAPFFVYAFVSDWEKESLPEAVRNLDDLEVYMNTRFEGKASPFAFLLKGYIEQANIHIQNLPKGSKVSSPKEAHQGQVNYSLNNESVEILGFYSTDHKGVFTHHDTNMHLHLMTSDTKKMGHLDKVILKNKVAIYLPKGK